MKTFEKIILIDTLIRLIVIIGIAVTICLLLGTVDLKGITLG